MARIRTVKPSFFSSLTVSTLPVTARLTFIGLWTYVDDEGRGLDEPRLVKAAVWPLDDKHTASKVEADLTRLADAGLIHRYTISDKHFLQIRSWNEHQRISHPATSDYPPPPEDSGGTPEDSANTPEELRNTPEPLRPEGKGKERNREGKGRGSRHGADVAVPDADPPRPEVADLCNLLADLIEANGSKRPKVTREWLDECRRLIDLDHRPPDEIAKAIRWAQHDQFWRANILSMPTLRARYDRLRLEAARTKHPPSGATRVDNGQDVIDAYLERIS